MRDTYAIRTPENVAFEFELAGIGARAFALLVDYAVMGALMVAAVVAAMALGVIGEGVAAAFYFVAAFAVQWGYGALCEWRFEGQTLGKRIVGIRVMRAEGTRITLTQAVVRNLVRIEDILPAFYFVGGASASSDPSGRRLGDFAARTVVVRQRRSPRPSSLVAPMERYNSFIEDPEVVHASRRITAIEREVMVALALRREQLPLAVRYALFAKMAQHFEERLRLPRPPHFSAERYVLNLAATLFAKRSAPRTS